MLYEVITTLPVNPLTTALLAIKLIDPISSPMTLLLVAFLVGIVQLLFAWLVKAYDLWRKGDRAGALFDGVAWVTMVVSLLTWAAARGGIVITSYSIHYTKLYDNSGSSIAT